MICQICMPLGMVARLRTDISLSSKYQKSVLIDITVGVITRFKGHRFFNQGVVTLIGLLTKLHHYGIQGKIYEWLSIWLTKRVQRVAINGHESNFAEVQSGIPQGTVLGPLMFLLYINDINSGVSSKL